jgi:hypothetical protein
VKIGKNEGAKDGIWWCTNLHDSPYRVRLKYSNFILLHNSYEKLSTPERDASIMLHIFRFSQADALLKFFSQLN